MMTAIEILSVKGPDKSSKILLKDLWNMRLREGVVYSGISILFVAVVGFLLAFMRDRFLLSSLFALGSEQTILANLMAAIPVYALVGLVLVFFRRRKISVRTVRVMVGSLYCLCAVVIWMSQAALLQGDPARVSFVGFQVAMVVAVVFDLGSLSFAAGFAALFALEAAVFWRVHALSPKIEMLAPMEPMVTIIFGIIAIAILEFHRRYNLVYLRLIQAEGEAAAAEQVNRTLLYVVDKADASVQALELGLGDLRRRREVSDDAVNRMECAQRKLKRLFDVFQVCGKAAAKSEHKRGLR